MSDEIELGVSPQDMYGDGMINPSTSVKSDEPDVIYPTFRYSGPEELELPDSGEMTLCFRKTEETSRTRKDGKHWYECTIEVRCICDVEDSEPEPPTRNGGSDVEEALDAIAAALHLK